MPCQFVFPDRLTGLPESRGGLSNRPQQVPALEGYFVEDISVGSEHTVALTSSGDVWVWGNNSDGQVMITQIILEYISIRVFSLNI